MKVSQSPATSTPRFMAWCLLCGVQSYPMFVNIRTGYVTDIPHPEPDNNIRYITNTKVQFSYKIIDRASCMISR